MVVFLTWDLETKTFTYELSIVMIHIKGKNALDYEGSGGQFDVIFYRLL